MTQRRQRLVITSTAATAFICGILIGIVLYAFASNGSPLSLQVASIADREPDGQLYEYIVEYEHPQNPFRYDLFTLYLEIQDDGVPVEATIMYPQFLLPDTRNLRVTVFGEAFATFATLNGEWGAIDLSNDGYIDMIRPFGGLATNNGRFVLIPYNTRWVAGMLQDDDTVLCDDRIYRLDEHTWSREPMSKNGD